MSKVLIPRRRVIETSALNDEKVTEVMYLLKKINQIISTRPKSNEPLSEGDLEMVSLDTLENFDPMDSLDITGSGTLH